MFGDAGNCDSLTAASTCGIVTELLALCPRCKRLLILAVKWDRLNLLRKLPTVPPLGTPVGWDCTESGEATLAGCESSAERIGEMVSCAVVDWTDWAFAELFLLSCATFTSRAFFLVSAVPSFFIFLLGALAVALVPC